MAHAIPFFYGNRQGMNRRIMQKPQVNKSSVDNSGYAYYTDGGGEKNGCKKIIEPLAEALKVSIIEIMKLEEIVNQSMSVENASTVISDSLEIMAEQQQKERKTIWIMIGIAAIFLCGIVGRGKCKRRQ